MARIAIITLLLITLALQPEPSSACNEVLCASVVSKCMLTQACKCEIAREKNNCSCCSDCTKCLSHHFERCCNCVGMCTDDEVMLNENDSVVGEIPRSFPELFAAITVEDNPTSKFTSLTFPSNVDLSDTASKNDVTKTDQDYLQGQDTQSKIHRMNCTVAYLSQCTSNVKCKKICDSIGASSYRFFFNGCCECVGSTCINYGLNEIKCRSCPEVGDDEYDEEILDDSALINTLDPDQTL